MTSPHTSSPARFERLYFLPLALLLASCLVVALFIWGLQSAAWNPSPPTRVLCAVLMIVLMVATWVVLYVVTGYMIVRKRFAIDTTRVVFWMVVLFVLWPIGLLMYLIVLVWRPVSESEFLKELTLHMQDSDPTVRAVAKQRLKKLPHTEAVEALLVDSEQTTLEVATRIEQLPEIPLKRAIRIERNFAAWSVLLALWLFFGFFRIFDNFSTFNDYSTALGNLRSPFLVVKPEFKEVVARVKPHLPALENLKGYFLVAAVVSIPAWLALFPIRKRFVQRQQQGPAYLLLLLALLLVVHAFGALLTLRIPMADTRGFIDVFRIRAFPFVIGVLMLILTPFFGRTARVFYQYSAIDNSCFMKDGVGRKLLERRQPESALALLNEPQWYHFVAAIMFPYVALPWGIINLVRGKRRSGLLLVIVSLALFVVVLLIGLATMFVTGN